MSAPKKQKMEPSPVTIGYWSIRGLGAPLRMMAMFAGHPINVVNYDVKPKESGGWDTSAWFDKKPELAAADPLMNLPYIVDGDIMLAQTNACMRYLGTKLGLWGASTKDSVKCDELLCELMDVRNELVKWCYRDGDAKNVEGPLMKHRSWSKLSNTLESNRAQGKGTFLVGRYATAPDFHLWEMLDQHEMLSKHLKLETSPCTSHPPLKAFHESFAALPENEKYLSSKLASLPPNQKMAHWGGTAHGGKWTDKDTASYDWAALSGLY